MHFFDGWIAIGISLSHLRIQVSVKSVECIMGIVIIQVAIDLPVTMLKDEFFHLLKLLHGEAGSYVPAICGKREITAAGKEHHR